MVTRASGSAIKVRIDKMVAATISSRSVKPRASFALCRRRNCCRFVILVGDPISGWSKTAPALLDCDRGLCSVDCDGLQAGIARSSSSDGQGSLSICLGLESESDHGTLAGNSAGAGRAGGRDRCLSDGFILAVNQTDRLAILREEATIRNVHQLQH